MATKQEMLLRIN